MWRLVNAQSIKITDNCSMFINHVLNPPSHFVSILSVSKLTCLAKSPVVPSHSTGLTNSTYMLAAERNNGFDVIDVITVSMRVETVVRCQKSAVPRKSLPLETAFLHINPAPKTAVSHINVAPRLGDCRCTQNICIMHTRQRETTEVHIAKHSETAAAHKNNTRRLQWHTET